MHVTPIQQCVGDERFDQTTKLNPAKKVDALPEIV